ncbi:MAG: hypothetical protein K6C40_02920 [Thermoguttaceae bacterium]|nr:hypothetical protein [Thermoguttaceae bacterium]
MTPFEDFLFYDAGREAGSESLADAVTILHFSGCPDFLRLERAISGTARHHSAARSLVSVHANGTLDWTGTQSEIQLLRRENLSLPLPPLQIQKEPGLKFWFCDSPDSDGFQLWFQFHHVTTDALGSFRFLEEIFERYAAETPENAADFQAEFPNDAEFPMEAEFPNDAELDVRQAVNPRVTFALICAAVWQIVAFPFRRKPRELGHSTVSASEEAPAESSWEPLFRTLTREETRKRLDAAHEQGVSVNDQILAAAFRAVENLQPDGRPIQIAVPVNTRSGRFLKMPLRNLVSVVFLRASRRMLRRSDARLLRWIHRQMAPKRKELRADLLLQELKWLCAWRWRGDRRGGMKWFVRRKTPLATLVVSNLGVLFRDSRFPRTPDGRLQIGSLTLDRVEQISPRTTDAAITLALGTYAGRLHFGLNWDPKRVDREEARRFLDFLTEYDP